MIIILIFVFILLLLAAALLFEHSEYSLFELERRAASGDKEAKKALKHEELISDVLALRHLVSGLLLIIMALTSVVVFGWIIGFFVAIILTISYIPLSRLTILQDASKKLYKYIEKPIADFIGKFPLVVGLICGVARSRFIANLKITSREELQYLIAESGKVLSSEEKKLIISSLSFADKTIRDVMIPRRAMSSISKTEFLGPLNLNDLYKQSGHDYLAVTGDGLDNIVGILDLKELLTLGIKKSMTADQVMDKNVCYINENQTLYQGMAAFVRTSQQLIIVVNKDKETVGALVLKDIIEALIGRNLIDEFDENNSRHNVAVSK